MILWKRHSPCTRVDSNAHGILRKDYASGELTIHGRYDGIYKKRMNECVLRFVKKKHNSYIDYKQKRLHGGCCLWGGLGRKGGTILAYGMFICRWYICLNRNVDSVLSAKNKTWKFCILEFIWNHFSPMGQNWQLALSHVLSLWLSVKYMHTHMHAHTDNPSDLCIHIHVV